MIAYLRGLRRRYIVWMAQRRPEYQSAEFRAIMRAERRAWAAHDKRQRPRR